MGNVADRRLLEDAARLVDAIPDLAAAGRLDGVFLGDTTVRDIVHDLNIDTLKSAEKVIDFEQANGGLLALLEKLVAYIGKHPFETF